MRVFLPSFVFFMLISVCCFAQDEQATEQPSGKPTADTRKVEDKKPSEPSEPSEPLVGFDWIKRFEGTWSVVAKAPEGQPSPPPVIMTGRVMGKWMVLVQKGKMAELDFEAVQTLGYDSKTKAYKASWVDSFTTFIWTYGGSLDDEGKILTLTAEGPDWEDPSKTNTYRDIYEFKSETEIATVSQAKDETGNWATFNESTFTKLPIGEDAKKEEQSVTPFLMFIGEAEAAIEFYKTVFTDTKVESIAKYKAGEAGKEGTVNLATIVIEGQRVKMIDSPAVHDFDFTPSFSFFVECDSEEQLKERFAKISEGGKVMMPLNDYGFSKQFGWASDKFGVSWQLNLK